MNNEKIEKRIEDLKNDIEYYTNKLIENKGELKIFEKALKEIIEDEH
jgi:hypothetical protein